MMTIAKQRIIGERVAAARQRAQLTQKQLAAKVKVSLRHIQEIEHGNTDVKLSVLEKIAAVINVAIIQLLVDTHDAGKIPPPLALCPKKFSNVFCPVDNIKTAMKIIDLEGTVWFLSSRAENHLGYSREDVCGRMKIWDFIDDDDERESMQTYIKCLLEHKKKPVSFVATCRRKDGTTVPITMNWGYLRDNEQNIAGFVATLSAR